MNLPNSTKVNKIISKNQFFSRLSGSKLRNEFTNKIQRITWSYKLSEKTLGIQKTKDVEEIQILTIDLKEKYIPKNALKLIDKTIPYPILYFFKYRDNFSYGISLKEENHIQDYYFSEWDEEIEFDFNGLDLKKVYEKIIKKFIKNLEIEKTNFKDVIEKDGIIKTLEKEIEILENKIQRERQFNKKVELNKELNFKKKELDNLIIKEKL